MSWLLVPALIVAGLAVVVVNLRGVLALLGPDGHYTIPSFDLKGRRALVMRTSHATLDPTGKATGKILGSVRHGALGLCSAKGIGGEPMFRWLDPLVTHTTIDGNLVTGQNQNSGAETAHRILETLATARNV